MKIDAHLTGGAIAPGMAAALRVQNAGGLADDMPTVWRVTDPQAALLSLPAWSRGAGLRGLAFAVHAPGADALCAALADLGLRADLTGETAALLARMRALPALAVALAPGWPSSANDAEWTDSIARLADEGFACVKLLPPSPDAATDVLIQALDHLIDRFGAERLMWGSDGSPDWLIGAEALLARAEPIDRTLIFGGTAAGFYAI